MPILIVPIAVAFLFLLVKSLLNGVRLSDTNIYISIAEALGKGQQLYTDIFFTNTPLYPTISRLYLWLAGGSADLFYLAAPLEAAGISMLLVLLLRHRNLPVVLQIIAPILYLSSFLVLSTSDHATGVFTAMLAITAGWLAAERKIPILAGILFGAAVTIKAYTMPIVVGFIVWYALTGRNSLKRFLPAFVGTVAGIMMPTLLSSYDAFLSQAFGYSLSRAAGLDKATILWFFARNDWLLVAGGIWALVLTGKALRKAGPEGFALFFQFLFILFHRDVYFFYLNTLLPFAVIGCCLLLASGARKNYHAGTAAGGSIVVISILMTVSAYFGGGYHELQRIHNMDRLVQEVLSLKPATIYGDADFAPAIAYQSRIPLLEGIIDTNLNLFRSGIYSADDLTDSAIRNGSVVVTYGASYPERNIEVPIASEIVNSERITQQCRHAYSHPIRSEGGLNRISVWDCRQVTD